MRRSEQTERPVFLCAERISRDVSREPSSDQESVTSRTMPPSKSMPASGGAGPDPVTAVKSPRLMAIMEGPSSSSSRLQQPDAGQRGAAGNLAAMYAQVQTGEKPAIVRMHALWTEMCHASISTRMQWGILAFAHFASGLKACALPCPACQANARSMHWPTSTRLHCGELFWRLSACTNMLHVGGAMRRHWCRTVDIH